MVNKQRKAVEACLKSTNDIHGKGTIIAVVWGIPHAGVEHDRQGMVVRQYQYGMDATGFTVSHDWKTVRYLHRDRLVLPLTKRIRKIQDIHADIDNRLKRKKN